MRIKLITSVGSAALILSGSVFAASPTNFGGVSGITLDANGNVTAVGTLGQGTSCNTATGGNNAGGTCSAPVSDVGFFQQEVTNAAGEHFFHTAIAEVGFSDENWVKAGSNGIRDKQGISEMTPTADAQTPTMNNRFNSRTELNMGWGNGLVNAGEGLHTVVLHQFQDQVVGGSGAVNMAASFDYTLDKNNLDVELGHKLDIAQVTSTESAGPTLYNATTNPTGGTHQSFAQRERSGTLNPSGNLTIGNGASITVDSTGYDALAIKNAFNTAFATTTAASVDVAGATTGVANVLNAAGTVIGTVNLATGVATMGTAANQTIVVASGMTGTGAATAMINNPGDTIASTYVGQTVDLGPNLGNVNSFGWGFISNETNAAAAELGLSFTNTNNPAPAAGGFFNAATGNLLGTAAPSFTAPGIAMY